jgi:hypothetical protein
MRQIGEMSILLNMNNLFLITTTEAVIDLDTNTSGTENAQTTGLLK